MRRLVGYRLMSVFCQPKKYSRMDKLLKAIWFVSLLAVTAFLLYVYAGLYDGQQVMLLHAFSLDKEAFFFSTLVFLLIYNFLFYTIQWRIRNRNSETENFIKGWLMGLGAAMNFFLFIILTFIQVRNGGENFDFTSLGYLIYVAIAVLVIWSLVLPVYLIKSKK